MTRLAPALVCALLAAPWPVSAQGPDPKTDFTTALGAFSLALDGDSGDERDTIVRALDAMQQALERWDAMIRRYEAGMAADVANAPPPLAAQIHLALGSVYLDRHRVDAALRELHAARVLDSSRAEALLAAAYDELTNDAAAATEAFRAAAARDPADPLRAYALARHLVRRGLASEAAPVISRIAAADVVSAALENRRGIGSPFIRLALVPERADIEPYFPPVRYRHGFGLLGRGDYEGAIAAWRQAAAADPLVVDAGPHRAELPAAIAAMKQGDVAAGIARLTAAVERGPARAEPHRLLGRALAVDEQYERAIEAFAHAVRLDARDERARLAHAEALAAAGRPAEAADALRATLAALPESGRARYALARLHQRQGAYEEAGREFEAAAALAPLLGLNGIYQTLGALHVAQQKFDRAEAAYGRRADVHPNDPEAHYALGDVYLRQARHEEALAEFAITLLLDPSHSRGAAAIAQAYLRTQAHEAAVAAARRALELDAAHSEARYVLGTALLRLGRADDGRRELEMFQRQQADAAAAHARQLEIEGVRRDAVISAADGDRARTVALLRRVLTLERSAASHLELGLALLDAGEPAEAIEQFTAAARLDAPYVIHRYLAEAYQALGQNDASRREQASYDRIHREVLRRRGGPQ